MRVKKRTKQRIRGSISIFLVIILVPMIALSGLIVDASRVQLAKSMVSSSGDLTMNSALANYDTVLKDVYGLFAMSQNDEELSKNLQKYFEDTLISNGIVKNKDEIETNPLLKDISAGFSGKTANLLNMELDKFDAKPVPNSNLAQPFILKNQIVEFEKYRAPANAALSLLDSIAAFSKFTKQSEVTQKKVTVDEKAEDFNDACKKLYKKLKAYDDRIKGVTTGDNQPKGYVEADWKAAYDSYKEKYKNINRTVVELMVDVPQPDKFINKSGSSGQYPYYLEGSYYVYIDSSPGNFSSLQSQISSLLSYIDGADFGGNVTKKLSDYQKVNSSLQLSQRADYLIVYDKYIPKLAELEKYFEAFRQAYYAEEPVQMDSDKETYTNTMQQVVSRMELAYQISKAAKDNVNIINNAKTNATNDASSCKSSITSHENWLSDTLDILKELPGLIQDVRAKAGEVTAANNNLQGAINNYKGGTSDSFSDGMQQEHDYNSKSFDVSNVKELENQIKAHTAYLNSVKAAFESVKYAGKAISNINSFDYAKATLAGYAGSSGSTYKQKITSDFQNNPGSVNDAYADSIFGNVFAESAYPSQNKPTSYIAGLEGGFWRYLQQAFGKDETTAEDEGAKDQVINNAKSQTDAVNSSTTGLGTTGAGSYKELPSSGATADGAGSTNINGVDNKKYKGFSSILSNMSAAAADLLNGFKEAAEAGRDNLYVVDYDFGMFSFYTQEAEYKVNNKIDKGTALKPGQLQTMTGINIDATNNAMYKSEIEYILYGHSSPTDNVNNAKQNIFIIRFIANAGYALTNAEIKGITLPPALAIQAASAGLIPYKLPQVVMQLCLALAESAMDIKLMEDGQKVAIIKTRDTWVMSPEGAANALKDYATTMVETKIDDITTKLKGTLNKLIDNTGEKVQVKTDDLINDITVAANAKATEAVGNIFNMFSDRIVASMDQALQQGKDVSKTAQQRADEIINGALKEIEDYINSTPDGIVKTIMLEYYNSNIKNIAGQIKGEVENAIDKIEDVSAGDLIRSVQQDVSKKIETVLNDLSNKVKLRIQSTIKDFADKLKTEVGSTIDTASKELTQKAVSMTNEFFDKTFSKFSEKMPTIAGQAGKNNSIASMLKFGYSDYLKMFMFLKLCVNDESIVKRTADVIQINVGKKFTDKDGKTLYEHKKGADFRMAKASTYIEVDATLRLKTMFIALPLVTKYTGKTGGDYFMVQYKSSIGY